MTETLSMPDYSSHSSKTMEQRRRRILELSRPKLSKAVWVTIEPSYTWGNQMPVSPISEAALKSDASVRVTQLATPKRDFQLDHPQMISRPEYDSSCGRSSVIWNVSPLAKKATTTECVDRLSAPKKLALGYKEDRANYMFGCGRSSPLWGSSTTANNASCSERTEVLSHPKLTHREYQTPREVQWPVSSSARNANPSQRVEALAVAKNREELGYTDPEWKILHSTLTAQASTRVQNTSHPQKSSGYELAQPKKLVEGYRPIRDCEWKVARSALRTRATERLKELSTPISRAAMAHVQFDPLAFTVKRSALKGRISKRMDDLAVPVSRGVKQH